MTIAPAHPTRRHIRQRAQARQRANLPSATTMRQNLRTIAEEAIAQNPNPTRWYAIAHDHAITLTDRHRHHRPDITTTAVCGIIAALSPGTDWDRNLILADTLLETGDCAHAYGAKPIGKALDILKGADPLTILKGRKERSFFRNLSQPYTSGHVTIDRHAFSILIVGTGETPNPSGRTQTLTDKDLKVLSRPGVYQYAAGIYRSVARELGITPQQLQNLTWDHWRTTRAYGTTTNIEPF